MRMQANLEARIDEIAPLKVVALYAVRDLSLVSATVNSRCKRRSSEITKMGRDAMARILARSHNPVQ
jgi:hypothetical protein